MNDVRLTVGAQQSPPMKEDGKGQRLPGTSYTRPLTALKPGTTQRAVLSLFHRQRNGALASFRGNSGTAVTVHGLL